MTTSAVRLGGTALALALACLAARPAAAQALRAVSQVLQVRAAQPQDVVIVRKGGATQPAHAYDWLMPGDRIQVVSPTASVSVYDLAARHSQRLTQADGPKTFGGAPSGGYNAAADEFFQGFATLFNSPRRPVAVETMSRGAGGFLAPTADPLLPAGAQSVPQGQDRLAVFWRGAGADATLADASGKVVAQTPKSGAPSAVLTGATLAGGYSLSVGPLKWTVATVDPGAVPEPPWMAGATSRSDPERVARAAWILRDGPPAWRLFAASELAGLAGDNYAADRLWQALQTGDFGGAAAP